MPSTLTLPNLGQRYALGALVGHGGNSSVYQAVDPQGQSLAVKLYDQRVERDINFVAHFRRRARQARSFDHPRVLRTLSYGYADEYYYLVSDYMPEGNFERYLAAGNRPMVDVLLRFIDVCAGLDYIHRRGLVHGNVKPSNMLMTPEAALLADAGPAHQVAGSDLTVTGLITTAIAYSSPEQLVGSDLSPASDIYSLGTVLYQACTGNPPFLGPNPVMLAMQQINDVPVAPRKIDRAIPAALDQIILRCLEKEPERRYASAAALAEALTHAQHALEQQIQTMQLFESGSNLGRVRTRRPFIRRGIDYVRRVRHLSGISLNRFPRSRDDVSS